MLSSDFVNFLGWVVFCDIKAFISKTGIIVSNFCYFISIKVILM